jgi:hypothetical protein
MIRWETQPRGEPAWPYVDPTPAVGVGVVRRFRIPRLRSFEQFDIGTNAPPLACNSFNLSLRNILEYRGTVPTKMIVVCWTAI